MLIEYTVCVISNQLLCHLHRGLEVLTWPEVTYFSQIQSPPAEVVIQIFNNYFFVSAFLFQELVFHIKMNCEERWWWNTVLLKMNIKCISLQLFDI